MLNKARYEELENVIKKCNNLSIDDSGFLAILEERIQTDWENNKENIKKLGTFKFQIQGFLYECSFCKINIIIKEKYYKELEQDKKFLQELANKYGVELE